MKIGRVDFLKRLAVLAGAGGTVAACAKSIVAKPAIAKPKELTGEELREVCGPFVGAQEKVYAHSVPVTLYDGRTHHLVFYGPKSPSRLYKHAMRVLR